LWETTPIVVSLFALVDPTCEKSFNPPHDNHPFRLALLHWMLVATGFVGDNLVQIKRYLIKVDDTVTINVGFAL